MFTGLIRHVGCVFSFEKTRSSVYRLTIEAKHFFPKLKMGDSIAVNGVCLTLIKKTVKTGVFELLDETLKVTALKNLKKKDLVNLERPLAYGDAVEGHFVLGHVDAVSTLMSIKQTPTQRQITFKLPANLKKYIFPKSSIAVDGISLTVGKTGKDFFEVYCIEHTVKHTRIQSLKKGDSVNLEADVLAKLAHRLI